MQIISKKRKQQAKTINVKKRILYNKLTISNPKYQNLQ